MASKQESVSTENSSTGVQHNSGNNVIVGYICGTLTAAESLTHDSLQKHDPVGEMLCIHSVGASPLVMPCSLCQVTTTPC